MLCIPIVIQVTRLHVFVTSDALSKAVTTVGTRGSIPRGNVWKFCRTHTSELSGLRRRELGYSYTNSHL